MQTLNKILKDAGVERIKNINSIEFNLTLKESTVVYQDGCRLECVLPIPASVNAYRAIPDNEKGILIFMRQTFKYQFDTIKVYYNNVRFNEDYSIHSILFSDFKDTHAICCDTVWERGSLYSTAYAYMK